MGRQDSPQIDLYFSITKIADPVRVNNQIYYHYYLFVFADNVGRLYAKYINVTLTLPERILNVKDYNQRNNKTKLLNLDNKVRDLVEPNADQHYQGPIAKPKQYGPARYEPLLPGMRTALQQIPTHEYATDVGNKLSWTIYADNAQSKSGEYEFSEMNRQ